MTFLADITRQRRLPNEQTVEPAAAHLRHSAMDWTTISGEPRKLVFAPYLARDTFALPTPRYREGYNPQRHDRYWWNGLADALRLGERWERMPAAKDRTGPTRYLDLGCSTGRVLRHAHLQGVFDRALGVDIDGSNVAWLAEHVPTVDAFQNTILPHLPFEDASFDVVSAFSVFTHIDTMEMSWLLELRRILRPGGIAVVTIQNERSWERLNSRFHRVAERLVGTRTDKGSRITEADIGQPLEHDRLVALYSDDHINVSVFHSDDYVRSRWGRYWNVSGIHPAPNERLQDWVVLEKT